MSKNVVVEEVEEVATPKTEEPKVEAIAENTSEVPTAIENEKPNYLWIIIPTALLVGALVGGLITYFSGISKLSDSLSTPSPASSITPEASPSVTPVATSLKRSEIKLQILNGSGTSGLAGKAKTYLEGLGYKDVVAGNAISSDFAETEIQIKDSVKEFLNTLTTDLSKNYTVSKDTKVLTSSSKYDIVITLGEK
ncbi:MAG: Cell envelope-like protein function transcriptional attenuator common domain protein [Candidatus Woesebacteria bacterium GW2011_GWA1_33_30]|uniref:Cell envelope-like protein function transcriptional attenuator common domain protein n=1 Tax=Candidatus Woesebacteria bacterium GW2011_GWA2_33_28 TaxID=1618561 RepID=A0A0F9ZV04_9BACT|nr:MAG: Cell envelope-like protein function transcriptional attenuator common domain protein [Candidatus Woesebacteria bacterium GW2011_GWA2_33_28]KKP48990.1 MAG: Cell envelope-like protein function transcriptional attenuator common domain protein [Candidatus Woesebacteria bacterium GW2011_GWA1_33_30]KKP49902.1 MAG: Cell envelope-like protein function transcriptional attenuator common domain protein [Microgenomates group bacterium GW2011_GWC1_33_32]KKP52582.1 MAG: Cell envelope-like protein func